MLCPGSLGSGEASQGKILELLWIEVSYGGLQPSAHCRGRFYTKPAHGLLQLSPAAVSRLHPQISHSSYMLAQSKGTFQHRPIRAFQASPTHPQTWSLSSCSCVLLEKASCSWCFPHPWHSAAGFPSSWGMSALPGRAAACGVPVCVCVLGRLITK